MKTVLYNTNDIRNFDFDKYSASLRKYGFYDDERLRESLEQFDKYDNLHYSCLIENAIALIPDEEEAKRYLEDHPIPEQNFERLRRITGYLVGSLERWNDGKKAEERERVKHGVYSQSEKDRIEAEKQEALLEKSNKCAKM